MRKRSNKDGESKNSESHELMNNKNEMLITTDEEVMKIIINLQKDGQ